MKSFKGLAVALGLSCAALAQAATVTWDLGGTINYVDQFGVSPGDNFHAFFTFSTSAQLNTGASNIPNGRYQYRADSMSLAITVNGIPRGTVVFDPNQGGSIILRNNSLFSPSPDAPAVLVDGLSFGLNQWDNGDGTVTSFGAILRGFDLSVFDSGDLPASPPPGLLEEDTHVFQVCRSALNAPPDQACALGFVDATIESLTEVPEPASIALTGLGLTLMWTARRRRSA